MNTETDEEKREDFTPANWPTDAQFAHNSLTKDGLKIVGLHKTINGYWYHCVKVPAEGQEQDPTEEDVHQDLIIPIDSPRVCNDDRSSASAYNVETLGQGAGEQTPETEVDR